MKKNIIILSVYTVLIFGICIASSAIYGHIPQLLISNFSYVFSRGLFWFLDFLPTILLSGFTISCCVLWRKNSDNVKKRFSKEMFACYKNVFFISIALTFILTLNQEIFKPSLNKKIQRNERAPTELEQAKKIAAQLFEEDEPSLAMQYAKKAMEISPEDPGAIKLYVDIKDYIEYLHNRELFNYDENNENSKNSELSENAQNFKNHTNSSQEKISKPLSENDKAYTILELLELSKQEAAKKDWFNAHYYASLAVAACDGTNTNLGAALDAANYAWNMLNKPVEFNNLEERNIFNQKREGYAAFYQGDYLKSYYIFADLKFRQKIEDPDVERYFSLAQEQVENQYFFFDETDNMASMKTNGNVYFSLFYPNGSRNVFFMKGVMNIKKAGGLVQYIEGLTCVNYSADGKFNYSFYVPYAKVISQSSSVMTGDAKLDLGINDKWKNVPLVQLCSVNRENETVISKPKFFYSESDLPQEIKTLLEKSESSSELKNQISENQNASSNFENSVSSENQILSSEKSENFEEFTMMILPISFDDFSLISTTSNNANEMSILELNKFMPKAKNYGFPKEIYEKSLLTRLCFPFFVLILLILCGGFGWSFRIRGENTIFKFIWIFIIPFLMLLMFVAWEFAWYLYNVINYVFVGFFGDISLIFAFIFYILAFFVSSLIFCCHKS